MAGIALRRSRHVIGRFGQCIHRHVGSAVAGRAITRCRRPRRTGMAHAGRRECGIALVASVALGCGGYVRTGLGQPRAARNVTGTAIAGRRARVHVGGRRPGGGRPVAGVALGRGGHMAGRFVLGVVDQIRGTVTVAGNAVAGCHRCGSSRMIHRTRHEGHETVAVAGIALRCGGNMRQRLGLGIDRGIAAAVAIGALCRRADVIHFRRLEGGVIGVAAVALPRRGDMRIRLAQRRGAIVAARTCACRICGMLEAGAGPRGVAARVAGVALRAGLNVGCRFGQRIGEQVGAAVTGRAIPDRRRAGCSVMAHDGGPESGVVVVAGVALRSRRNVRGRLAQRCRTVMAIHAFACRDQRVMHEGGRRPGAG